MLTGKKCTMKIRFLGQSGYILKSGNTEIIIDPYLSDSVNRVAGRPRALPIPINPEDISCDAVICTHNHLDHLDPDTVERINENQFYITTNEGKAELLRLGRTNVKALNTGDSVTVGDFNITAVFADHTVEAFGLIVKAEGKTLYFSGDTLFNEKLFGIAEYKPNYTFICINGRLGIMICLSPTPKIPPCLRKILRAAKRLNLIRNILFERFNYLYKGSYIMVRAFPIAALNI